MSLVQMSPSRERVEAVIIDPGRPSGLEYRVVNRLLCRLGDSLEERRDLVVGQVLDGCRLAPARRRATHHFSGREGERVVARTVAH